MDYFKLHSEYHPTGDQPQAIKELVEGFQKGNQFQTLLVCWRKRRRKLRNRLVMNGKELSSFGKILKF